MKTRTLCWFGGAALVCAWAVVYLGADYSCRYPESRIGKWYLGFYEAAVTLNPVSILSRAVAGTAAQLPPDHVARVASQPHAAPTSPAEAPAEPQPIEIINLACIQAQTLPPQIEDEPVANVAGIDPVVLTGAIAQNAGEPADVMPPCIDEQENLPAVMPHADDAEESQEPPSHWLVEFWKKLFYGAAPEVKWELPAIVLPIGGQEESEMVPGGKAPLLREDSSIHQQYPGCPFLERCPGVCPHSHPIVPAPTPPTSMKKTEKPKAIQTKNVQRHTEDDDAEESEDHARHPEVDTMEFRRSDARPGDFDPVPF